MQLKGRLLLIEIILQKIQKISLNTMQRISSKNSLPRNRKKRKDFTQI